MYLQFFHKNCYKILVCFNILMIKHVIEAMSIHIKCRSPIYPRSTVKRFPVPDEKVPWSIPYAEYEPHSYTASSIHGQPWADPEIGNTRNIYYTFVTNKRYSY